MAARDLIQGAPSELRGAKSIEAAGNQRVKARHADVARDEQKGRSRPRRLRVPGRFRTRRGAVVFAVVVLVVLAASRLLLSRPIESWWQGILHPPTTVYAVGDIACDPADHDFNSGIGLPTNCAQAATARLIDPSAGAILLLGDDQYECGGIAAYQSSFDKSWGAFKGLIRPAPGNHEHQSYNGTNCDATGQAGGYFAYFGSAAHQETRGHYSFNLGTWHLIALDSTCRQVGGCGPGSEQEQWLRADLAANKQRCILAYWHHPRWSSGIHGSEGQTEAFWDDLYAAGADIVLNGHDHDYERFAPQSPAGLMDPEGIREFVVGTGGRSHDPLRKLATNSRVRNFDTFGVLKLSLRASTYSWSFIPVEGSTFTDSGRDTCHAPQPGPTSSSSPDQSQ
jgi:hypothetical protein